MRRTKMLMKYLLLSLTLTLLLSLSACGGAEPVDEEEESLPSRIAFVSFRDGNFEIYVMDADGFNQQRLTYNRAWNKEPSWSP